MISTFSILVRTWSDYTGLKWDPSPLAAQIALIQGSNVPAAFLNFEFQSRKDLREKLKELGETHGIIRLGYWQATDNVSEVYYGIIFMKTKDG
jgi:hypothetical protein